MTPAELRALADQATPGPWIASIHRQAEEGWVTLPGTPPQPVVARTDGRRWLNYQADADLIAALGPDAARLLADAMEYVEAHHDGMDWANDLLDRFASLGEDTP